jgi:UDPglucose 6-dehydrogenase
MKVTVIGAGYVGLVQSAGLAHLGHTVRVGESDQERLEQLRQGSLPIYEPGLEELFTRALSHGLISLHADNHEAVAEADVIFLALPTPPDGDGRADLSILEAAVRQLVPALDASSILAVKSTVPVGTNALLRSILDEAGCAASVVSNPEFLSEGSAVDDFLKAERIVIGADLAADAEVLRRLYGGLDAQVVVTDPVSAELTKYAANAYLATRLTFFNAISNLAEEAGADVTHVLRAVGLDRRIGGHFMRPGPGYGGSCFPKDTSALLTIAADFGYDFPMLESVISTNDLQRHRIVERISQAFDGDLAGIRIAMWGIAFKAGTDDTRDSPALAIADAFAHRGATVVAWDPEARTDDYPTADGPLGVVEGADLVLVATEWPEFLRVDLAEVAKRMRGDLVFDARNLLDPQIVREAGLRYECLGRPKA